MNGSVTIDIYREEMSSRSDCKLFTTAVYDLVLLYVLLYVLMLFYQFALVGILGCKLNRIERRVKVLTEPPSLC